MNSNPEDNFQPRVRIPALAIAVRGSEDGPRLATEPVSRTDFSDVFSEAWRDACLRRGHPRVPLTGLPLRVVPTLTPNSNRSCTGFEVQVTLPDGTISLRTFTPRSLGHVGHRAAQQLLKAGGLNAGQTCHYELVFDPVDSAPAAPPRPDLFRASVTRPPLSYLKVPLRELLAQSTAVAVVDESLFPVFYTEEAFALAEKFSRRGGDVRPAVETGGALIGSLCSCPESGEFFAVVNEVLEVMEAEQTEFALAYTSRSWTRIQSILRARQAAHPEHAERLLGQTHGHNFVPNDGKICASCLQKPACSLTNVFTSQDDQAWSRAVFARQPWQLCHIFGLAARGDKVNALFSLADGRLQPRGFFKLPHFDPEHWTPKPVMEELSHAQI